MSGRNILIIGNYPPPYGGVPHHVERLSEHLSERGWSCHVLSGGTSGHQKIGAVNVYKPTYPRKLLGLASQITDRRFREWLGDGALAREESSYWRRYKMYADIGEQIVRRHDINIIASYNLLNYAPVGSWLAEKYRLPHLISVFGEVYKFPAVVRSKAFFTRVASNASRLLSCSDHCGNSLKKLDIQTPVHTVTYGINMKHFNPGDASALRARLGLGDEPVVLFVGRLGAEMGLDSFLAAAKLCAARYPRARFVMVGQRDNLADQVEQECQASNGRFQLASNVPYDELANYYRLATVVVVPTRGARTCSSLAAMEAMATRKPVVGFAIGGIPEIVVHEQTGLLAAPDDVPALAASIERVLGDTDLAARLAEAGYQQALERFDEPYMNIAMERHFLDALGTSSR